MDKFFVSLIIASKDPEPATLTRCIASFAALKYANHIQLVIVESGIPPQLPSNLLMSFASIKRVHVCPEGVYAAYNSGIHAAEGTYLLFFGIDDIALPGMDQIFYHLEASPHVYCLYAASCYMQATGIRSPSPKRVSLLFANWCHQGIFYCREYLSRINYNLRYKMQADHALNISIVSNPKNRIGTSNVVVSYFSKGGISSEIPDLIFRKDLPSIAISFYGKYWGYVVRVKQVFADLFLGPPESRFTAHRP